MRTKINEDTIPVKIIEPEKKSTRRIKSKMIAKIEGKIRKVKIKNPEKEIKEKLSKPVQLDIIDKKSSTAVIFDTNFLTIPGEFKLDIFQNANRLLSNPQFFIFDKTIFELQKIAHTKSKSSSHAKVGLELINQKNVQIIQSKDEKYVDDLIIDHKKYLPEIKQVIIATEDKGLRQKLIKNKIKILYMASRKKLALR